MWKCIVAFIVVVFLVAIVVGQDNEEDPLGGNSDVDVIANYQSESSDSTIVRLSSVNKDIPIVDKLDDINLEVLLINKETPQQFLDRISYAASYNKNTKCPNWVAWLLTAEHTDGDFVRKGVPYLNGVGEACGIGMVNREISKGDYFVDMEVAAPRPDFDDWAEMPDGMSHGHMCPAGDNKWSKAAMNQSFLLTNMCPQDASLNSGGWRKLEEKCRDWAKQYGDIYIVTGPVFYDGVKRSFGKNKIGIPDAFFKVVLCTNGMPKAIGFIYSNDDSNQSMNRNVQSVDEIEEVVGMDFFHRLPDSIEGSVEEMKDLVVW